MQDYKQSTKIGWIHTRVVRRFGHRRQPNRYALPAQIVSGRRTDVPRSALVTKKEDPTDQRGPDRESAPTTLKGGVRLG